MTTPALTYDDVLLVPKYSEIKSRTEIDIGNDLDDFIRMSLPIIASPMDTVCGARMATTVSDVGGLGIIHRYNTVQEQAELVKNARENATAPFHIGAAVGVTGDYILRAKALVDAGAEVVCIDVAHGHHSMVCDAIGALKKEFQGNMHLMAGNVATVDAYRALCEWGADSVRVGIGGGSICSTRLQTGHGVPNVTALAECAALEYDVPIIADGGIKNSGDIVKALAVGADFVMVGSLLAGTEEAPGEYVRVNGHQQKVYRGMASSEAQTEWKGSCTFAEGVSTTVPCVGPASTVLEGLRAGILSGFSYSGATTIQQLWMKSELIRQTGAGQYESSTHILDRR